METLQGNDLIARARSGDEGAFRTLVAEAAPKARSVVRRLVGHPDDAEDILQDATLKAWQARGEFEERSLFSTWFTAIAARQAVDFLRKAKRWRTEAQVAYANLCAENEELSSEIGAAFAAPDFAFEVREHIAYCFTCVGRSLPPDEQAALVLRDVCQMSGREAADALGISQSVLGHRLSAARQAMVDKYEGLCALVNKAGICHQCSGLRAAAPEAKRGGPIPDIAEFADRLAAIREVDPQTGRTRRMHDVFWRRTAAIEEAGAGSIDPGDCGIDD
jgi:RNA polymerase sigma-70 factor (ECF subfamily)